MNGKRTNRRTFVKLIASASVLSIPSVFSIHTAFGQRRAELSIGFGLNRKQVESIVKNDAINRSIGRLDRSLLQTNCRVIQQHHASNLERSVSAMDDIFGELNRAGLIDAIRDIAPGILTDFSYSRSPSFKAAELRVASDYGLTSKSYDSVATLIDRQRMKLIDSANSKVGPWRPTTEALGGHGGGLLGAGGANAAMLANWANLSDGQKILAILSLLFAIAGAIL